MPIDLKQLLANCTPEQREELRAALAEPVVRTGLDIYTEKPKDHESYSYVDTDGRIVTDTWTGTEYECLLWQYSALHRTRASAELELAHRKAEVELTRRCVALGGRIGNKPNDGKNWYTVHFYNDTLYQDDYKDFSNCGYFFLPERKSRDAFMQTDNFENLLRAFYYMEVK